MTTIKHPLINNDSPHYKNNGKQSICVIEEKLTVDEMIGACTFNIMKYQARLEKKGQKEADLKKIETYKNYKELLLDMSNDSNCGYMLVMHAYKFCGIEIRY